jgi:hypothetical protein
MEPPGLPEQLPRHVDAQAAVTLLQLTTPIRARCPQARTLLGELAATTDPNLSWIQRRPPAPEVSCPPASSFVAVYGQDLVAAVSFPRRRACGCERGLQSEQLLTFNGLF